MTSTLQNEYDYRVNKSSDIYEHLPIIYEYAKKCKHLTEFGMWTGNSTIALLASLPEKLISVDIRIHENTLSLIKRLSLENNINFTFINKSSTEIEIENTDLLMIDSLHLYEHLKKRIIYALFKSY